MKALTSEELAALRGCGQWDALTPEGARWEAVLERLVQQQRMSRQVWQEPNGSFTAKYTPTDLGRLALRVSLPGMALPT